MLTEGLTGGHERGVVGPGALGGAGGGPLVGRVAAAARGAADRLCARGWDAVRKKH